MLGGMDVAVAAGMCLTRLRLKTGLDPALPTKYIVFGGLRDVDPLERELLDRSECQYLTVEDIRAASGRDRRAGPPARPADGCDLRPRGHGRPRSGRGPRPSPDGAGRADERRAGQGDPADLRATPKPRPSASPRSPSATGTRTAVAPGRLPSDRSLGRRHAVLVVAGRRVEEI